MSLEGVRENQLAVPVVIFALQFGNCFVTRLADGRRPVFLQIDEADDRHPAERMRYPLENLTRRNCRESTHRTPVPVPDVVLPPGFADLAGILRVDGRSFLSTSIRADGS